MFGVDVFPAVVWVSLASTLGLLVAGFVYALRGR